MLNEKIDDSLMREYLQENPDFFTRNEDLLAQLQFRHSEKGAVSLSEDSSRKLRQRVQQLEEITELMINARRNEAIFNAYSNLYVQLLRCNSLTTCPQLKNTFENELDMPVLTLKFFESR